MLLSEGVLSRDRSSIARYLQYPGHCSGFKASLPGILERNGIGSSTPSSIKHTTTGTRWKLGYQTIRHPGNNTQIQGITLEQVVTKLQNDITVLCPEMPV